MSIVSEAIWAPSPSTTRGQPTVLSTDAKGERIAYASGKSIFVRSIDEPQKCRQYTGHTAQATVARFAPSGYYIASGDASGSVRVWDPLGEGTTKGEYHIIAGRINDVAWDGDSQRIIAVGDGKERFGHCITADSGNTVGEISGQGAQINCVAIRQQRPLRAATGSDDTSVAFYHGAPFKFNAKLQAGHSKFVYGAAFSPDGAGLVTVGSDRKICLYDGKTGEPRSSVDAAHAGSIFGVSWSQDSKSFATCSADQTVKIWDAETAKCSQTWRMGGEGVHVPSQQVGVVWPHGRADGLIISVDLEGNLNYLVPEKDQPTKVVRGHQGSITAVGLSGDAKLYTGSFEGRVRSWDISAGTASAVDGQGPTNYVSAFTSSPDPAAKVHSVGWDDTLRTLDPQASTFLGSSAKVAGQPAGVATTRSGLTLVAAGSSLEVYRNDERVGGASIGRGGDATATCIAASPSADVAVVGCSDRSVLVWDVSTPTPKLLETVTDAAITSAPSALAFSRDGARLAVGTTGGRVCALATQGWSLVTSRWSAHTARVTGVCWSPDGAHAASGSLDTNVFVWSVASPGARVKAGNAHKDGVNGVVWAEGGRVLSVGADSAVKVWKVDGLK